MAKRKHTHVVTLALAAATPALVASTTANAATAADHNAPQSISRDGDTVARLEARQLLMNELAQMSTAEKMGLAAARLQRANLNILALKSASTAASCSNPCPATKLLCPHKTTVPAGCPSTVTSSGCGIQLKKKPG